MGVLAGRVAVVTGAGRGALDIDAGPRGGALAPPDQRQRAIPGPVATSLNPEATGGLSRLAENERVKTPEDVAPLALFLATQPDVGPTAQTFSLMRRDP